MIKSDFNAAAHGLRGIASLMVFFAHLLGGTAKHVYDKNDYYVEFIQRPWNFGVYGVELFFVISGFVIVPSVLKYSPWNFATRRFFRLYPLFFAMSVVFVIANGWSLRHPELHDPLTILSGFLFLNLFTGTEQLTPNAWTLTYEVIFYGLICFLLSAFRLTQSILLKGSAIGACLLFVGFFPIALYFAVGVFIRYLLDNNYYPSRRVSKLFEIAFAVACIYLASEPHFQYTWETMLKPVPPLTIFFTALYFYFAVIPGSITTLIVKNRILSYFGMVSYSLYLVHPYIYLFSRMLFEKLGLFSDNVTVSMIFFFLFTTPLTVIFTHFIHVVLERAPYQYVFGQGVYRVARESSRMQNA